MRMLTFVVGLWTWIFPSMVHAEDQTSPEADTTSAAKAGNEFAFDLYQHEKTTEGNLFFSPSSIHTALSMTAAGARGKTLTQITSTLHFVQDTDRTLASLQKLLTTINESSNFGDTKAFELCTANALWAQKSYPIDPAYSARMKSLFGAPIESVDFSNATEQSRKRINDWVSSKTNNKIKDLLGRGSVDAATRLVLTNAIYFKAPWANQFSKSATKPLPFHITDKKHLDAQMMRDVDRYAYYEDERIQMIEMPYSAWALSMIVVLPRKVDALPQIEKELTAETFAAWAGKLQMRKTELIFPKFKFETSLSLNSPLAAMGMSDAFFADTAEFSGMTTAEKFFISGVIHKAFIDLNEEGTEAAAATAVVAVGAGMPKPEEPAVFKADHPFFFAIRHNRTGAILFMGRLTNPTH